MEVKEKEKFKFLVLGCNGMAGHMVSLYLKERKHEVVGFAREKSQLVSTIVGDANDIELLRKIIEEGNFDFVVNCIGILNQFAEKNKEQAVFLNSYLPHLLAKITETLPTRLIHISTDCVFSGRTGAYTEDSFKDGETFYDRTKALGEIEDEKNVTLRGSIVGPDIKKAGIGLLNWFMQQVGEVNGYTKAIWTGQTTLQLAKTIEQVALRGTIGLYNTVPTTSINKYELLKRFNKYLRNDSVKINPVDGLKLDKTLIRKREGFDYKIPEYEVMVIEMAEWIYSHKDLYQHYNL